MVAVGGRCTTYTYIVHSPHHQIRHARNGKTCWALARTVPVHLWPCCRLHTPPYATHFENIFFSVSLSSTSSVLSLHFILSLLLLFFSLFRQTFSLAFKVGRSKIFTRCHRRRLLLDARQFFNAHNTYLFIPWRLRRFCHRCRPRRRPLGREINLKICISFFIQSFLVISFHCSGFKVERYVDFSSYLFRKWWNNSPFVQWPPPHHHHHTHALTHTIRIIRFISLSCGKIHATRIDWTGQKFFCSMP